MWTKREKLYSPTSQSCILHLQFELQTIRRDSHSMSDYLDRVKTLSNTLAAARRSVEPHELVYYTLGSLSSKYEPFIMSITAKLMSILLSTYIISSSPKSNSEPFSLASHYKPDFSNSTGQCCLPIECASKPWSKFH